ncbi:flagellar protein FlaG [Pseudalkalibacillus caeni]|uniref:flagellar protein FlaG n=1 Tax=Exobacillus caeni TaxID=2574798 RepID=UPI001FEA89D7|nr:flagellar protein FlaG [Pseudalkalibacillus caeni]
MEISKTINNNLTYQTKSSSFDRSVEILKQVDQKTNEEKPTKEKIDKKIESLNNFLNQSQTSLKFQLHEKLKEYYVQIIDTNTEKVIKEIPPKKFLDMYAVTAELLGLMVDEKY